MIDDVDGRYSASGCTARPSFTLVPIPSVEATRRGCDGNSGKGELAAEAADVGEHVRRVGRADGSLHQVDGAVAGFDVYASGGVLSGRLAARVVRVWW